MNQPLTRIEQANLADAIELLRHAAKHNARIVLRATHCQAILKDIDRKDEPTDDPTNP